MSLITMLHDYSTANEFGKQDMFEEAAERMITAEKSIAELRSRLSVLEEENGKRESIIVKGRVAVKEARRWLLQTHKGDLSQEVVETYLNMIERALSNQPDTE